MTHQEEFEALTGICKVAQANNILSHIFSLKDIPRIIFVQELIKVIDLAVDIKLADPNDANKYEEA